MASYSIEDVELLRRRAGISYQEAVALLDYHNGNVTRALIDLERNGRLKGVDSTPEEKPEGKANFFQRLFRTRVKVFKKEIPILNVSVIFCVCALIFSPYFFVASILAALLLGYRMNVERDDSILSAESLGSTVRQGARQVRSAAQDAARGFNDAVRDLETTVARDRQAEREHAAKEPVREIVQQETPAAEKPARQPSRQPFSYYQSNPALAHHRTGNPNGSAPTLQMPLKVDSADGSVSVERDDNGYSSATIG